FGYAVFEVVAGVFAIGIELAAKHGAVFIDPGRRQRLYFQDVGRREDPVAAAVRTVFVGRREPIVVRGPGFETGNLSADGAIGAKRSRGAGNRRLRVLILRGADLQLAARDCGAAIELDFAGQFGAFVGHLFDIGCVGDDVRKDRPRGQDDYFLFRPEVRVEVGGEHVVVLGLSDPVSATQVQSEDGRVPVGRLLRSALAEDFDFVSPIDIEIVTGGSRIYRDMDVGAEARFQWERHVGRAFPGELFEVGAERRGEVREHLVGLELDRAFLDVPDGAFVVSRETIALAER